MTQIKKATNRNLPKFYSPKVCDGKFAEIFLCQTITLHWQHKHICKYTYTGREEFGVINDVFALGFTQSTTFCFRTVFLAHTICTEGHRLDDHRYQVSRNGLRSHARTDLYQL